MKTEKSMNTTLFEQVTLTLPKETVEDLERITSFKKSGLEDLILSYIAEGMANDSLAVRRMKFTDTANEALGRNNIPPKTIEDIFDNLVY